MVKPDVRTRKMKVTPVAALEMTRLGQTTPAHD